MAPIVNLDVDQGADFGITFTYCEGVDGDPFAVGAPIDVTGYTALMQLRTSPGSVLLLELTDSAGITVGTTDGTFAVAMTAVQTLTLDQDCHYDLLVTSPGAEKIRLAEGTVSVDLAISE